MESSHGQLTQTRLQFGYLIRRWWIANRRRVVLAVERHKRIKSQKWKNRVSVPYSFIGRASYASPNIYNYM